jgi:hypothetical protein
LIDLLARTGIYGTEETNVNRKIIPSLENHPHGAHALLAQTAGSPAQPGIDAAAPFWGMNACQTASTHSSISSKRRPE